MSFCFIGDKEAAPSQMEPEKKTKQTNRKTTTLQTHMTHGHASTEACPQAGVSYTLPVLG